jgi:ubiquinone/menaquinone biosynthesis C-methylase UbiE
MLWESVGMTEARKQRERDYHDHLRGDLLGSGDPKYTAYRKWYQAGYKAHDWLHGWLKAMPQKRLLDYCCGEGDTSIQAAKVGAKVTGIDISPRSIEIAREKAKEQGVVVDFRVMDAENTDFGSATFDMVVCNGVLHHLDLTTAYREIARILKPDGMVIALECLGHNPLINWYRRRTPYLRSPDEHPLHIEDVELARQYFRDVRVRYFNLATLAAAPLWKTPLFRPVAALLAGVDALLLRAPVIQRQAWMVGMLLREQG